MGRTRRRGCDAWSGGAPGRSAGHATGRGGRHGVQSGEEESGHVGCCGAAGVGLARRAVPLFIYLKKFKSI
jgi:hypothetical protein